MEYLALYIIDYHVRNNVSKIIQNTIFLLIFAGVCLLNTVLLPAGIIQPVSVFTLKNYCAGAEKAFTIKMPLE